MVGQERSKKVLSVAVYNHYKRIFNNSLSHQRKSKTESDSSSVSSAESILDSLSIRQRGEISKRRLYLYNSAYFAQFA